SYNCKPTGSTTTPAPVALVVGEGYGISSTISRDYEITDKKATLKLLDGTIEEYDLTDKKAKVAFEKKYGKIIHINTNVNANIATSVSGNVNVNSVITIPAPKASVNGHLTTATVAPAAISHGGVTSVGSLSPTPGGLATTVRDPYSHVITGNEDIMIVISNKTTRQELENYKKQMNAKGIELSYDGIEYNDKGLLVSISGTMKGKDGQSNFVANDFDKLVLAMIKKGDKTWFKVSVKEKEVI
ncbi:MAG: hypothetical protein HOP10_10540, partial [Chitinophagaceae bacterium]|nr:hypothetical protein [Chitinophagaceae bacterium]